MKGLKMGFLENFGFGREVEDVAEQRNRAELGDYLKKATEDLTQKDPEIARSFYNNLEELVK